MGIFQSKFTSPRSVLSKSKIQSKLMPHHYLFENKRTRWQRILYFQKMWNWSHRRKFSGYRARGGK